MKATEELLIRPEDCEIRTSRVFNAPRPLVFKAWTDPEYHKNWWGPTGFTNTFQVHELWPGGKMTFIMHGPDGKDYLNECVFVKIDEPALVAWDHLSKPVFQVVTTFEEAGKDQTRVIFRMVFNTAEECKKVKAFAEGKNEENFDKLETELLNMKVIFQPES